MGSYKQESGDLIRLALQGEFDVIAHGCNCFCIQKSGLAPQMVKAFKTDDYTYFPLEARTYKGDFNKLGNIQSRKLKVLTLEGEKKELWVVNCYTQYYNSTINPDKTAINLDYEALTMCLRKINHAFRGKKIGLPKIGAGLAGGDWDRIKSIIITELKDCDITIINYKPSFNNDN